MSTRAKLINANGERITGTMIAALLNRATGENVSPRTVQQWLSGRSRFPIDRLYEIADLLDIGDHLFRRWCFLIFSARATHVAADDEHRRGDGIE